MAVIRKGKSNKGSRTTGSSFIRWLVAILLLVVFVRWAVLNSGEGVQSKLAAFAAGSHVAKFVEPVLDMTSNQKYPPLSCSKLIDAVKKNTSVADPNQGQIYSRTTALPPLFQISVHNQKFDPAAWHIYERGYFFETEMHHAFSAILNSTSTASTPQRVIDIGGHIGYFSLLAAAHGNVIVDSFEPNLKNSIRFCESMMFNNWYNEFEQSSSRNNARINWHPYATGRTDGALTFQEHPIDPGMGKILKDDAPDTDTGYEMRVVTLDNFAMSKGWFQDKPVISILKVDVDGYEAHVMEGATNLLNSHIVRNIFMEASIRTAEELKAARLSLMAIVQAGYKIHKWGDATGPYKGADWSHLSEPKHIVSQVIAEAAKDQGKFLNVWWTL